MLWFKPTKLPKDTVYYHVTHWKAGSQWLRQILDHAFNSSVVEPELNLAHIRERDPEPGRIYPCCYITWHEYQKIAPPNSRRFVVIRDLRDTLVSGYFSLRYSHSSNAKVDKLRSVLANLNLEDGLLHLMEHWLIATVHIQQTWVAHREPIIRLEDFMSHPASTLHRALHKGWDLRLSMRDAERLIRRQSYERVSGGRRPGEELVSAHYRKGIHGDWKNHFTPRVVEQFKKLHNDLLIKTGYETSDEWDLPKPPYEPIDQSSTETLRR